jgi:phytoene desaturase
VTDNYNIIGSGYSGLSVSALLAQSGLNVNVFEKNATFGGRSRQFTESDFIFDMGPSWYWMPDVFERFFERFGKKTSDYYDLVKLDPGFQIIFDNTHTLKISRDWSDILDLFETYEPGSADKLNQFINDAEYKYNIAMRSLIYQPGLSFSELFKKDIISNITNMSLFNSYRKHVAKHFKNPFLKKLLEFPVLFLGASPKNTPGLYSLMAYSGLKQGTYYPIGGFGKVIDGMVTLCKELGVKFHNNHDIKSCTYMNKKISQIQTSTNSFKSDVVICSADYHHFDHKILESKYSNYSEKYWDKRVMSPSCLIYYLGIDDKLDKLEHHNLFFDRDIDQHTEDIYTNMKWPEEPLFYVCCPSKTDNSISPKGKENLFLLMPISSGINDSPSLREKYFKIMIDRLESYCGQAVLDKIIVKKSYCINNFKDDYNAYKGNAYGLANTLSQTANFKPKIKNKYLSNLYYTGQLTVPGPGVPPSIISGEIVADYILKTKTN